MPYILILLGGLILAFAWFMTDAPEPSSPRHRHAGALAGVVMATSQDRYQPKRSHRYDD